MPRKPINYDNACIYQFEKDGIIRYIGSTTNFTHRKSQHKTNCNNPNKNHSAPIYKFIRNNGGWDDFKMILIENYKCKCSNELRAREQHFFNEFKPTLLNFDSPMRSHKQYREDNKQKISIRGAKYYEDNKVAIAIKKAKYREDNKEKVAIQQSQKYQRGKARKLQLNNEIV